MQGSWEPRNLSGSPLTDGEYMLHRLGAVSLAMAELRHLPRHCQHLRWMESAWCDLAPRHCLVNAHLN